MLEEERIKLAITLQAFLQGYHRQHEKWDEFFPFRSKNPHCASSAREQNAHHGKVDVALVLGIILTTQSIRDRHPNTRLITSFYEARQKHSDFLVVSFSAASVFFRNFGLSFC